MNVTSPSERLAHRIVGACATTACAAALFAILIRVLDQWYPWAGYIKSYYGMAPHTASALLLLSAALCVRNRSPQSRGNRIFGSLVVGIVGAAGLVVIARACCPIRIEFEAWLASLLLPAIEARPGHMSPHTALTFLCTASALGCLLHCRAEAWWSRQLVFVLAALALTSGATAALGHAVGTPLLYGPRFTSMKWVTASIFVLLNGSLMLAAFPKNWLVQGLARETGDGADVQSVENRRALALIWVFFTFGVVIIGFYFLRKEQASLRLRVEQELETVADLKAVQIADWRRDRLKDANLIFHAPYAGRQALDALAEPSSEVTRKMFTAWLDPFLAAGPYTEALVLDDKLNVGVVHPPLAAGVLSPAELGPAQDALRTRQLTVADLHRPATNTDSIRFSLMVPIVVREEGDRERVPAAGLPPSKTDRSAAVLILRLDPRQRLFPLVQTWPTQSRSAELLLVRRAGDEGLYLSELRFQTNAALQLRFPAFGSRDPVVPGSLSRNRVLFGLDYRRAPVVAAVRSIPNSPWWIVAKMDVAEIYAPVRERARILGAALGVLVIAVALGLNLLWRRRDNQLLRWQVANEHERLVLAQRLAHVMKHANDIVGITDDQWQILEINDSGLKQYGYTLPELQKMRVVDLRAPAVRRDFPALAERFWKRGYAVAETVHQRKDGSTFPVEVSIRKVVTDGVVQTLSIIRDITKRKAAEAKLRESEALLRAFYDSPGSLRAIVELVEEDILVVSANAPQAAAYGRAVGEMANVRASELGVSRPVIDLWRDKFRECETKRAPVTFEYSTDFRSPGGWGLAIVCSLGQSPAGRTRFVYLAHDITARKQAEEALRHSENRYRSLVETAQDAILTLTPDGVFTSLNPAFEKLTGWPRDMWIGKGFAGLVHPDDLPLASEMAARVAGGEPSPLFEIRVLKKTGDPLAAQIMATPQRREGKVHGLLVIARDVTEFKRMEEELLSHEARLVMALESADMVTWEWDIRTGAILHAKDTSFLARDDGNVPYGSQAELLEKTHPEDRERFRDAISRTVNERAPLECDCRVRMPDGNYRWMLTKGRIILEADGKPVRVLGMSMDITQRKQAEQEILSLSKFPAENPSPVLRISKSGQILYSNPPAKVMISGFADDDGRLSDEWRHVLSEVFASQQKQTLERVINHRTFSFIASPVIEQSYVNIYGLDITELKELQQQLVEVSDHEQARIGQDLHDGLSQLLVSAAFDLSRLEKRTTSGRPEVATLARQAGDTIDAALTQARSVARGLFAVQLGGDGLVHALRDLAASVAARHQVSCKVHCPESVPVANDSAATHLFRIAREAVNNAIRHAKPRHIEIRLDVKAGQIDMMVSDDGSGFEPNRNRRAGMGLHIMDYRARALNGTFKIERAPSKGTRVFCSVPRNEH